MFMLLPDTNDFFMNTLFRLQVFVVAIATILLTGCAGKTLTTKNTDFSVEDDPLICTIHDLCYNFDVKERSVFGLDFEDCQVSVKLEPKRHMITNVKVNSNETKDVVYKRSTKKIDNELFNVKFCLYHSTQKYVICDFTGVLYTNIYENFDDEQFKKGVKDIDWKEVEYSDYLINDYFEDVISGDLKFYTKNEGAKEPSVIKHVKISDEQIITTDYWPNGQEKIVKEYSREDEEITAAYNYNEDGTQGNPMEIAFLMNDGLLGFTSNLRHKWTKKSLYLVLSPEEDWRHGKVLICFSGTECQYDYTVDQRGYYNIDSSNHIRFYNMKDGRGNYEDECRLSLECRSKTNIVIKGTYGNQSTSFVSNLNLKDKSWFISSLASKYNMY